MTIHTEKDTVYFHTYHTEEVSQDLLNKILKQDNIVNKVFHDDGSVTVYFKPCHYDNRGVITFFVKEKREPDIAKSMQEQLEHLLHTDLSDIEF